MAESRSVAPVEVRRRPKRRGLKGLSALAVTGMVVTGLSGVAAASIFGDQHVGTTYSKGILLPSNQYINPIGTRFEVTDGRLVSSTINPAGTQLAALTWENFTGFLTIMDLRSGAIIQQLGTGAKNNPTIGDGEVAADGPFYSPDGKSLWFPQSSDLVHFNVEKSGKVDNPVLISLTGEHGAALPSGMAFSANGQDLYVALNGSNTLGVIDTATNTLIKQIPVGNAPRQVVLVGNTAYVSNEGGPPARPGQYTNLSDGTPIVANKKTGAAIEGTVSVVNLTTGKETSEIRVGLEPTALYLAQDGTLMVANSNDDSFSLIDTATDKVLQTVNTNPLPGSTVGSYPNSITMPDASHILVSVGRDDALAEYAYNGPKNPVQYLGLLPTDWYPVGVAMDNTLGELVVTNDKGIGARGPASALKEGPGTNTAVGHNTYDDTGSVTVFAPPSESALAKYTHQVFVDNNWEHLLASDPHNVPKTAPVAIPAQLGQPSLIKHVVLIVRENRTYDQVLGDIGKGNSDPADAQFGGSVTPNAHALADDFGLFDNFYDEGTLSADGHNWLMQADATDYIEKEFGAFYRSYPASGADALAYQRDGFLWNAAEAAGDSVTDFGEYVNYINLPTPTPTWSEWYKDALILQGKAKGPLPVPENSYKDYSDINSLNAINHTSYPIFDLDIPDQYRADIFFKYFKQYEKNDNLPNLTMMWLPDDHTSGVGSGDPYPVAEAADNDLALGRIVDTISHSQFWPSTAIFVVEDDTQNGVDHVDGHRGPMLVISPYTKHGQVNDTYYTQLNLVRTIEQILGIEPMNQEDRAAEPMYNAFTNTPNMAPYNFLPNEIPLTYGLHATSRPSAKPAAPRAASPTVASVQWGERHDDSGSSLAAQASPVAPATGVPAAAAGVYREWQAWSAQQHFGGTSPIPDWANPEQLNRLDWYNATGWTRPYPGDTAILAPSQVPGANLPADYLGD